MNASNIQPLRPRQPLHSSLHALICTLETHLQWISVTKTDEQTNPGSVGLGTVTKLRLKLRMNDCCCCLRGRFISTVTHTHMHTLIYRHTDNNTDRWSLLYVFLLAQLQTWRAITFSRVCLSVCLWPALLPFNVNRFWRNLVTRTLLWSSLAATIMVQVGRRGTARCLLRIYKKILKNHRIQISKFWSIIFCICVSCVL